MRSGTLLLVACAACYQPSVKPGAPCSPDGDCPATLECHGGFCVAPGTLLEDASIGDDADAISAGFDAAVDAQTPYVPWGTPIEIAVAIGGETDPTIAQNRLAIVFMSENDDDLYSGVRASTSTNFTFAELATLNTLATEKSPELSSDGLTLHFVSDRDGDYDVYRSTFAGGWSAPVVVPELSTNGDDSDIAISPDGLTAIVLVDVATNRFIVHTRASATAAWGAGTHHPELSVTADAAAPTLTNDAAVVYLHAGGTRDLYVAYRTQDGQFTTPVPVAELNVATSRDAAPFVLGDNKYMVFERSSDLYETTRP